MRAALAVALVLVVATGCDGDDDDVAISLVPAGAIDIDLDPVELPAAFPDEVPIPADVVLAEADRLEGETAELFDVTGWHDGDPIRAARDYLAVLDDEGFEVTSRTEAPDSLFFVADNGTWFVSAGFFPDPVREEGTSVGFTVGPVAGA